MSLLAVAILLKRTVPKNLKKSLSNLQYNLKMFFLLHEKLNVLNSFKQSLLNVQYDLKNQDLNILMIHVSYVKIHSMLR